MICSFVVRLLNSNDIQQLMFESRKKINRLIGEEIERHGFKLKKKKKGIALLCCNNYVLTLRIKKWDSCTNVQYPDMPYYANKEFISVCVYAYTLDLFFLLHIQTWIQASAEYFKRLFRIWSFMLKANTVKWQCFLFVRTGWI